MPLVSTFMILYLSFEKYIRVLNNKRDINLKKIKTNAIFSLKKWETAQIERKIVLNLKTLPNKEESALKIICGELYS